MKGLIYRDRFLRRCQLMAWSERSRLGFDQVQFVIEMHDQWRLSFRRGSTDLYFRSGILIEIEDAIVTEDTRQIFDVSQRSRSEMTIYT